MRDRKPLLWAEKLWSNFFWNTLSVELQHDKVFLQDAQNPKPRVSVTDITTSSLTCLQVHRLETVSLSCVIQMDPTCVPKTYALHREHTVRFSSHFYHPSPLEAKSGENRDVPPNAMYNHRKPWKKSGKITHRSRQATIHIPVQFHDVCSISAWMAHWRSTPPKSDSSQQCNCFEMFDPKASSFDTRVNKSTVLPLLFITRQNLCNLGNESFHTMITLPELVFSPLTKHSRMERNKSRALLEN